MTAIDTTRSSQGSNKMQQIERYGVIVLVFFLVTIVAVSFWGDSKSPGFWARLTGKGQPKKEQNDKVAIATLTDQHVVDPNAPLSPATNPIPPVGGPVPIDGNVRTPPDMTPYTPGPIVTEAPSTAGNNPFYPNGAANGGTPSPAPVAHLPAPQPTSHAEVAKTAASKYVVQKGDSLASIARREFGEEGRWTEIQALNDGISPKSLRVGQTIALPSGGATLASNVHKTAPTHTAEPKKSVETKKAVTPAVKTASKSGGYYVVKKGDALRAIAREQLGDESRWKDIAAANPGLKPDQIFPGEKLRLPGGGTHASSGSDTLASIQTPSTGNEPRVR
jgi:LysM repeat protein